MLLKVLFTGAFSKVRVIFLCVFREHTVRRRLHTVFGAEARTNKVLKVEKIRGEVFILASTTHSPDLFQIISELNGIVGDFQPAESTLC